MIYEKNEIVTTTLLHPNNYTMGLTIASCTDISDDSEKILCSTTGLCTTLLSWQESECCEHYSEQN